MTSYEGFIEKGWAELGLFRLLVARVRSDGTADYVSLLIDLWCLGVKDCLSEIGVPAADLREFMAEHLSPDVQERIHPACAKKLIDGAVAYAESFGFSPPRDFRKVRKVFSALDGTECPTVYSFGRDGRPCYVRGPNDSDERVDRVWSILEARCGAGGFDYVDLEDEDEDEDEYEDEDDDDDLVEARYDLMDWLDEEPPAVPRFYEVSGLITGLLLCPAHPSPNRLLELLWGPAGRIWADQDEMQVFLDLIMNYWNLVNSMILFTVDPTSHPEEHPVDIQVGDFEGDDGLMMSAATMEWARGFMRSTTVEPEAWAAALGRPDLAPHWEIVRAWAGFLEKENRDRIVTTVEADPKQNIARAIAALARALRS